MLRSNTDNGLGTDRLSRHIAIFFQHLSAGFLFLSRKKRHIDEESFDTYADLNHGTLRVKFASGRGAPTRRYLGHIHGIFRVR